VNPPGADPFLDSPAGANDPLTVPTQLVPARIGALAALFAAAPGPDALTVTLPDGPAAKAWAGVDAATVPAELPAGWRVLEADDPWSRPETWKLWADLVAAEREGEAPRAEQRAGLALLARAHGRAQDAWGHFGTLTAAPEWAAAVLPYLLPGAPASARATRGGDPGVLPPGVVLAPLVPPSHPGAQPGDVEVLDAEVRGVRIGEARVALRVRLETGGVQVDVEHLGGGPARLFVLLPEPEGFEIRVEYNDWMVQDTLRQPLEVRLEPDAPPVSLWGRFLERPPLLPRGPAGRLPAQLALGGLALEVAAEDPDRALLDAAAAQLERLLGIAVRVHAAGESASEDADAGWSGTRVRLSAGAERAALLRGIASAAEAYLLGREG